MQVNRLLNLTTLRDELDAAGYPYQALGIEGGVLLGYCPNGTTELVPDAAALVVAAHDPSPLFTPPPSVEERLSAVEAAALDLMLIGLGGM